MEELRAGVARADITPPIGIPLVGFAGRGPSEGVHDPLLATALVLEFGGTPALILTADLLFFNDRLTADVRQHIERATGVPAWNILLCASHTHYGPPDEASPDSPPEVAEYLGRLKVQLAEMSEAAFSLLQPVSIGYGVGRCSIGINRRERRPDGQIVLGQNPGGPCDREVRIVRLDTAGGQPYAAVVNFACHPVSAGGGMRQISADYIRAMRELLETYHGVTVLFLQGAAGNINPVEMRHSFEPAQWLGTTLGGEVAKVFALIRTSPAEGLAVASTRLELPAMAFESLEEAQQSVEALQTDLRRLESEGAGQGSIWWAKSRLERGQKMLDNLKTGAPLPTIPAEISCLRFGDIALVTSPGEIFTETGRAIKKNSPIPATLFAAYSNGSIGYVPVPEAYAEGGYEVTHACQVGPKAAGMIEEAALTLLKE